MPASFVVGAKKVFAGTEPRVLVLTGDEYELREKLINELIHRPGFECDLLSLDNAESSGRLFVAALRQSKEKCYIIRNASQIESLDWLTVWLNKVHRIRLVFDTDDAQFAAAIERKANTRGLVIDCSAPKGDTGKSKLAAYIASWFNLSITQVNLLLSRNNWQVSECMQLLEKLRLLKLPLNNDTIAKVGLVFSAYEEFISAMYAGKYTLAMSTCPRLTHKDKLSAVAALSVWLDNLSRVKVSTGFMKSSHDIALETELPTSTVEELRKLIPKYDVAKLNRMALAISNADRDFSKGYSTGVIENMVNSFA